MEENEALIHSLLLQAAPNPTVTSSSTTTSPTAVLVSSPPTQSSNPKQQGHQPKKLDSVNSDNVDNRSNAKEMGFGGDKEEGEGADEWVVLPTKEEETIGFEKSKAAIQKLLYVGCYGAVFAFDMSSMETPRRRVWTSELRTIPGTAPVTVASDENFRAIFAGALDRVFRLDPCSGKCEWECSLVSEHTENFALSMAVASLKIFVGTKGHLSCVDANSGATIWSVELGSVKAGEAGTITVVPAVDKNLLIAGKDGNVYAIDIDTGREIWKDNLKGLGFHPLSLVYNEKQGVVYVGTNGTVRCLNIKDHAMAIEDFSTVSNRWLPRFGVSERVSLLLLTANQSNDEDRGIKNAGVLFIGTQGSIFAVDPITLKIKWKNTISEYTAGALQSSEPISLATTTITTLGKTRGVLFVGFKSIAVGIDTITGTSLWIRKLTTTKPSETRVGLHTRGGILITSCSSKYFGIEASTGEILWEEDSLSTRSGWFSVDLLTFASSSSPHTNTNNTHHSLWK